MDRLTILVDKIKHLKWQRPHPTNQFTGYYYYANMLSYVFTLDRCVEESSYRLRVLDHYSILLDDFEYTVDTDEGAMLAKLYDQVAANVTKDEEGEKHLSKERYLEFLEEGP